ncbi:MAG: B12-binding domain-containing radical SAM protein [Acidiferrobacterales bacterium]
MRVLLVYSNQTRDLLPAPPIGLSYVASATRDAGHEVRFLDLLLSRKPLAELRSALQDFRPQVVGISVRNIDNVVHQRLARHVGELAEMLAIVRRESSAAIVLGGPAISVLNMAALDRLDADFAVIGEGEVTFPELLATLEAGSGHENVAGIVYRKDGRAISTGSARLPRFGPSGMEGWVRWRDYERRGGTWAIQTKRGCPMQCSYCAYPAVEGRAMRRRSAAEIVDEIEHVAAVIRPRTFEFVDSTFNLPAEHSAGICREIIRRGIQVNLTAMGVNPLGVSRELFTLMRQAGFNSMMITPEAANDTMLRNLRKGFSMEHVHRSAALARESGISSTWFFMLGGPGETRDTVEETVAFVEQTLNWKNCLSIFMTGIRILPGTELAQDAIAQGTLPAHQDFLESVFYFSPGVSEAWMLRRINRAVARHPNIVHAAEEGGSAMERLFYKALHITGVAPPYWRFLPAFLRCPPLPALRRHFPAIGRGRVTTS